METSALRTLWTECFGNEDGWIDTFLKTAFDPSRVCALSCEGRLAAALSWMDAACEGRKLAYLYAIGTHPDYRGQGLCRELMGLTHEKLAGQGYAGCILVPADAGLRQMYGTMGYVNFGGIREIPARAGKAIPLRQVIPEEYAALRRAYLPKGGVVQEAGAIEYLAACADLYAGQDFLLAAVPEGEALFGLELLGDAAKAGGILGALGYERGTFRAPGDSLFAMFRPLTEGGWTPGYFGLAFE